MEKNSQEEENREAGAFFQRPAYNAFERLLCSHLIEASKNDQPLNTVTHTCRAVLSITKEAAAKLEIDQEQAKSLYTVAERLASTPCIKYQGEITHYNVSLRTTDWKTDLKPWVRLYGYYHSVRDSGIGAEQEIFEKNKIEYFHEVNRRLTASGFHNMVSDFLEYSIPICEDMSRKLATLVSPETYSELLRLYHNEKVEKT